MTTDERVAAGTADVALLAVPALAVASWIVVPWTPRIPEMVSATSRAGYDPWSNYAQFAVFAGLVGVAFAAGYRRAASLVETAGRALCGHAMWSRPTRAALWILVVSAAAAYAVNAAISATTSPLTDDFHEGEYLGFIAHLRAGGTLADALTVHGLGVDLLPAYAAVELAAADNGIVVARIAYALLRAAAVFAAFAGIALLCRLLAPGIPRSQWAVATLLAVLAFGTVLRVGGWPDELPLHKPVNARDAGYLVQVGLVLAFAHAMGARRARPRAGLAAAILVGATLPWGPVYSYDRGLYGVAFVVVASIAMLASPWRARWIGGVAAGAAAATGLLLLVLPRAELAAVADQIGFWVAHGRDLWSQRGIAQPRDAWIALWLAGAAAAMACAIARIARSLRTRGAAVVTREPAAVVMLAASLPCLRMAIERSDSSHVAWAVTPAWMLAAAALATWGCAGLAAPVRSGVRGGEGERATNAVLAVVVATLVGFAMPLMDPVAAARRIEREYVRGVHRSDDTLLSAAQRDVRAAMRPAMADGSCLVTLTNESTWYYVLGTPSCTRFHHVTNARTPAAQAEVIAALERARPEWILFANQAWSNVVDGVSLFNASPALAAYVMSHYVPDRIVAGNWFWRRGTEPARWIVESGAEEARHPAPATRAADVQVEGIVSKGRRHAPPVAILLTTAEPRRPLWSGRPDVEAWRQGRWSATVPTAALPAGRHRLQAWARFESSRAWLRLGDDVALELR